MKKYLYMVIVTSLFLGCGGGGSSSESSTTNSSSDTLVKSSKLYNKYDGSTDVIKLSNYNNSFNYQLDLGSYNKNVYLIFTNTNNYEVSKPSVIDKKSLPIVEKNVLEKSSEAQKPKTYTPLKVLKYNQNPPIPPFEEKISKEINKNVIINKSYFDQSKTFYDYNDNQLEATCKKVVTVDNKTLSIWVENSSFDTSCSKARCVTQTMVDKLADTFLKEGANNDIYDWVHNILGEEWENSYSSSFIDDTNEITILLSDIDYDNSPDGGVIGFFYSRDNYTKITEPYSNEKVMFYIDSVMFANGDSGEWSIDDDWPKETVITLAHEFQHMIHFYQKFIKKDLKENSDTWINEMCSAAIEDLLANKLKSYSPRNVEYYDESAGVAPIYNGRLVDFNQYNYISLTNWYDESYDEEKNIYNSYAITYSFGAYLLRNYGGASLLKNIISSNYTDYKAVVEAVNKQGYNKTFADLIKEWGVAVLFSNNTSAPTTFRYNSGDWFKSSLNSIEYNLGSINLYNYVPNPKVFAYISNFSRAGTYPHSNMYYLVGSNLSGEVDLSINVSSNVDVTVVLK